MAHVWLAHGSEWSATPLKGDAFSLGTHGPGPFAGGSGPPVLLRSQGPDGESWLVVTSADSDIRLNGTRLLLGIYKLGDRDEIGLPGTAPMYFSTEQLACVAPFPGSDRVIHCPRCKLPIDAGTPAVRCPACKVYHHQNPSADLPCWTHAGKCSCCPQPTALDAGYGWMPAD